MKTDQKTALKSPHLQQVLSQVGESLRTHRVSRRLTQDLAAVKAEISRQTASRIEQGDPSVSFGQMLRYADVVGATQLFAIPVPGNVSPDQRRVRLSGDERTQILVIPSEVGLPLVRISDPYHQLVSTTPVVSEKVDAANATPL